jgi:diaminopropionate ammonia-lyase
MALMRDERLVEARLALGLGPDSNVLLVSTEGAVDPEAWRQIVGTDP